MPLSARKEVGLYRKLTVPGQVPGVHSLVTAAGKAQGFRIVGNHTHNTVDYIRDTANKLKAGERLEETPIKKTRKRKAANDIDGAEVDAKTGKSATKTEG